MRRYGRTCAVMTALCCAACASRAESPVPGGSASPTADTPTVVPWVYAPTQPSAPTTADTPPAPRPTDARPCTAHDVSVVVGEGDGAGGHLLRDLRFRNVSESTCVLRGYPEVTATEPGQPDVVGVDGSFFPSDGPANMPPGASTFLGVETDTYCAARPGGGGGGPLYHRVRVVLPSGDEISIEIPDGLDATCGLRLTPFSVPRPEHPDPPSSMSELTAVLQMPATVQAGGVLSYVVALTNPTDQAVVLSPCPAYLQTTSAPSPAKDIETLNCGPVGAITAGQTLRFEMRIEVPADAPDGPLHVFWNLIGPDVKGSASDYVQVDGAPSAAPS